MSVAAQRVKSLTDIVRYYSRRPSRIGEVRRWASHRGSTTLNLRLPWWNYPAIAAVDKLLPDSANVFEFGGGGSTLWLCDRGARVTTVEHDAEWVDVLANSVDEQARILSRPATSEGARGSLSTPGLFYDSYVASIREWNDEYFDLVIVDGRARVACVEESIAKVRVGGALLLDDSNRSQYARAGELLSKWKRYDYRGAKPGGGGTVFTSIWLKP